MMPADPFEHSRMVRERIENLSVGAPRCLRFPLARGVGEVLVSPDASKPGRWRATTVDEQGPVGHSEAEDFGSALWAAHCRGANVLEVQR